MLGVLYSYAKEGLYVLHFFPCCILIHNTQWRGLAKLLILVYRQCEGQMIGVSDGSFSPTSFLFPH